MNNYKGTGILTLGNGNDNNQFIKYVDYDIQYPLYSSGGFCIEFLTELSEQERQLIGLRDDDGNLFEIGDGINSMYWSISDLDGIIILCNQPDNEDL